MKIWSPHSMTAMEGRYFSGSSGGFRTLRPKHSKKLSRTLRNPTTRKKDFSKSSRTKSHSSHRISTNSSLLSTSRLTTRAAYHFHSLLCWLVPSREGLFFNTNCYWFCHTIGEALKQRCASFPPQLAGRGQKHTWLGLPTGTLWQNIDFEVLLAKYDTMWQEFEEKVCFIDEGFGHD